MKQIKQRRSKPSRDPDDGQGLYKDRFSISKSLVMYASPRRMDPYPQRYRTIFTAALYGYLPVAAGPQVFYVKLNTCYFPFTAGGWLNPSTPLATLAPTGYSTLNNASMYQKHRVLSSRIEINVPMQDASETIAVTITPSFLNTSPNTVQAAKSEQFTTSRSFNVSSQANNYGLRNKISVARLLGVRESAIQDDLSGQFNSAYNASCSNPCYWVVNVRPYVGATVTDTPYEVLVQWEVECYGDSVAGQPETFVVVKRT